MPCLCNDELAGALIGIVFGAPLITFFATAWLILKSNFRPAWLHRLLRSQQSRANRTSRVFGQASGRTISARDDALYAQHAWEKHLPQMLDDDTVRSSVQTFFHLVELHVENYYRDEVVSINREMQAALDKVNSQDLPGPVVSLLPQTQLPTILIKHCLIRLLVSRILPDGAGDSFLPSEFTALPTIIQKMTKDRSRKRVFDQAYSRWRVLSAYLRPSPEDDQSYLSQRDARIRVAIDLFSDAFSPWVDARHSNESRRQHLATTMVSAAETGILIFSQPCVYSYRWTVWKDQDHRRERDIVVSPAFLKVTDEYARSLQRPQVMVEMATAAL